MKISNDTLKIFSYMASINPCLVIEKKNSKKSGTTVKCFHMDGAIFMSAKIPETFENDVYIGSIGYFLGIVKSLDDPNFEFKDNQVIISDNTTKTKLTYSQPETIYYPSSNNFDNMEDDVVFTLSNDNLEKLVKTADILQLSHIRFVSDGKNIKVEAISNGNPSSDSCETEIGDIEKTDKFDVCFDKSVLRFMSGDYKVTMQIIGDGEAIAKFENQDTDVTYVVGSDADAR